jgi:hypothetical protein
MSLSSRSKKTASVSAGAAKMSVSSKISRKRNDAATKRAESKGQKKEVTWKNERGGELESVRYVSPVGERSKLGEHVRTGSKKISTRDAIAISKERRGYSELSASSNVDKAKQKLSAYKGALNIVSRKAREDKDNVRKQAVEKRAKELVEEAKINLEVAKERYRSVKLSAKRGY